MKFEIFRKKEEYVRVNCFDIAKDKNNKICYLEIRTIVVSRSKAPEYLVNSKEILLKLNKAIAKGYEIRIVEKGARVPNNIATYENYDSTYHMLSNYVKNEYVRTNKDNTDTNFANTMYGPIVRGSGRGM